MKKSTTLFFMIAISTLLTNSQTYDYLDVNNISARINAQGALFNDFPGFNDQAFEVPLGGNKHTIFAGGLWIGGLDVGGQLHLAVQTFNMVGEDFWAGVSVNDSLNQGLAERVWKIEQTQIDEFDNWFNNPFPAYVIPDVILNWPGNASKKFFDRDGDGNYDPAGSGDYPLIMGDQAILFIYNDDKFDHTESGAAKLGVQICGMAYAFDCDVSDALDHTLFIHYDITNMSFTEYEDVYVGCWTDLEIGRFDDDFVGCDVARNSFYGYNGDPDDDLPSGYGQNPPAQSVTFLKGPMANPGDGIDNNRNGQIDEIDERLAMSKFVYYNNNNGVTGNPENGSDYYSYLRGIWKDGLPMTYGGTGYGGSLAADFMFPGDSDSQGWGVGGSSSNPNPQTLWDENSVGNIPSDRRGIGSVGPFTLESGQTQTLDIAYVYGRAQSGGQMASVDVMKSNIDMIQTYFDSFTTPCGEFNTGIDKTQAIKHGIYPNPINQMCVLTFDNTSNSGFTVGIYDLAGKEVRIYNESTGDRLVIYRGNLESGTYIYQLNTEEGSVRGKLLVM